MKIDPMELTVHRSTGKETKTIPVGSLAGVRFAARDIDAKRRQLDEMLERDGRYTGATRTSPSVFRLGRYLLTQSPEFEVQGALTGGEAEVVLIRCHDEVLVTVGSDQCDRELDALFPDKPKQMCPHPVGAVAWPASEVRAHWDQLQISSRILVGKHEIVLQKSFLSVLVDLDFILAMDAVKALPDPAWVYCGSAPFLESAKDTATRLGIPTTVAHGIGDGMIVRLSDPVMNRTIEHRYRALPVGDDYAERMHVPPKRLHEGKGI
ncbi:MAG: DUF2848 domain-containing protein [Acidobacteria bacterium]|nr:DUF2848 domain-containing protein [Acidobacteriota bacterium]